jgi:hypothetical protein
MKAVSAYRSLRDGVGLDAPASLDAGAVDFNQSRSQRALADQGLAGQQITAESIGASSTPIGLARHDTGL